MTDGVFAIAMTLLVLDLKVSSLGEITNSADLFSALTGRLNGFPSFVISFLLLGSMRAVHSRQFEYIKKTDRHLTMLNTLRLLVVVLVPLSTSIAGSYQSFVLGRMLLPINFLALSLISFWQWSYAVDPKNGLADERMDSKFRQASRIRNESIIYLAVLVVALSFFIGEFAFIAITLSPFVEKFLYKKNKLSA